MKGRKTGVLRRVSNLKVYLIEGGWVTCALYVPFFVFFASCYTKELTDIFPSFQCEDVLFYPTFSSNQTPISSKSLQGSC